MASQVFYNFMDSLRSKGYKVLTLEKYDHFIVFTALVNSRELYFMWENKAERLSIFSPEIDPILRRLFPYDLEFCFKIGSWMYPIQHWHLASYILRLDKHDPYHAALRQFFDRITEDPIFELDEQVLPHHSRLQKAFKYWDLEYLELTISPTKHLFCFEHDLEYGGLVLRSDGVLEFCSATFATVNPENVRRMSRAHMSFKRVMETYRELPNV